MTVADRLGVYFYAGTTQTKKSTRALEDLWADRDANGFPCLIIDSQGVWNFRSYPHVQGVEAVCRSVWGGKPGVTAWTPSSVEEVDKVFAALRAGRRVNVLTDECRFWLTVRRLPDGISRALRVWAHSELVLRFTTQRIGDIHADALACHKEIYVFRTVGRPDLERLEGSYGVEPKEAMALPDGEFLTVRYNALVRGNDGSERKRENGPAAGAVPPGGPPAPEAGGGPGRVPLPRGVGPGQARAVPPGGAAEAR